MNPEGTPAVIAVAADAERVTVTGTLTYVETTATRQERLWASAVLACDDGHVHIEVWPKAFGAYGDVVFDGTEVVIEGTVDRRDGLVLRADVLTATGRVQIIPDRDQLVIDLNNLRRRRGTSQRALADRMGVSQQMLSAWEARTTRPTRKNLAAWCAALGQPPPPFRPARYETCGKPTGRAGHRRRGDEPCDPCLDAAAAYMNSYRAAKRAEGRAA